MDCFLIVFFLEFELLKTVEMLLFLFVILVLLLFTVSLV